jgi:D-beta-D-heptose 7-phosphate kinase/D-beta-D-heptose 1-phosphate adenosyltransferase
MRDLSTRVVLVTGGFDPIHSGHIAYFTEAKKLGSLLVVGVNSDKWLSRKKGAPFMDLQERKTIVSALRCVDHTLYGFNDDDGSANDAIRVVREMFPWAHIVFANGGDRTKENIPEMSIEDDNISFKFGVGGDWKMNSSSDILKNWNTHNGKEQDGQD